MRSAAAGSVFWNVGRLFTRRWKRYGRAAVTIGAPISLGLWFDELERDGIALFDLERPDRLTHVQRICDRVMERIGALVPVTPVTLACAAIQTFDAEFIDGERLISRMDELRSLLPEINARTLRVERSIAEIFDRAYRMLRMRKIVVRQGTGYLVLSRGRPLVSFYANSISHLLGRYAAGIRERDALPVLSATGNWE